VTVGFGGAAVIVGIGGGGCVKVGAGRCGSGITAAVGVGRVAVALWTGERIASGVSIGAGRCGSCAFTVTVGFGGAAVTVGIGGGGCVTVGAGRRGWGVLAADGRTASIRTLPGGGAEPK
jgi:hypothetical protein